MPEIDGQVINLILEEQDYKEKQMHSQEQACQKGSFWMASVLPGKRNQGVNTFDA